MKIEANQVLFLPVFTWFRGQVLRFVGRSNTIQLLETAMVIEGQRQTLSYVVIDFLFQQALSEWTTVTIPYSRIVRCRWSTRWIARGLFLTLVVLPAAVALAITAPEMLRTPDALSLSMPLLLLGLVLLSAYLLMRILPAQYDLVYRRPNGHPARTRFRIKSRARRREFEQRLESYRQAAAQRTTGEAR